MWGKRRVHLSDAIKCRGTINSYGGISGVHFLITSNMEKLMVPNRLY